MSGYAICPKCLMKVILKYPIMTKINPFSTIKLFTKALSGNLDDQKVICPNCGYKAPYGDFEKGY